jgi:hypothetical protein
VDVFQFQSFNFPDRYIRHQNFQGELTREVVGQQQDFSFELVDRGRDQHGARLGSLRSVNFPTLYLRHRDFRLRLEGPSGPGDQLFREDSTFYIEPGLANPADSSGISFRSVNYPGSLHPASRLPPVGGAAGQRQPGTRRDIHQAGAPRLRVLLSLS